MAYSPYNPDNLAPMDNPDARWCDYCGEIIEIGAVEDSWFVEDIYVHDDCLREYGRGIWYSRESVEKKVEDMIARGMS